MRIILTITVLALAGLAVASVRRALCHHGHLCTCQNGETGLCDQHGHCHCIHGRALCHHGHLCTCQNGETGICDQHGHCHCIHG
ncbi:integrin beta-5-like isoform X4 [Ostrea edulis]|uniref:integrin beta-5-like isoform X4 n=1 Tax=Ostrea edulis TaxID=37623 RepID=UPI0024AF689B|nr:integrin beta-5-like isoform X4 [Ostrea edulis]